MIKNIIWDWNGTLLDDVRISLKSINEELELRGIKKISLSYYREHFSFPVKDFYESLGFDFKRENFTRMSNRFLRIYFDHLKQAPLYKDVPETLSFLKKSGIRQFILSAMEQKRLEKSLEDYHLLSYFERVQGLNDIFAEGKTKAGKELLHLTKTDPAGTWMIGDTLHDLEVAHHLNLQCVLLACGHQSPERLKSQHPLVVDNFIELQKFLAAKMNYLAAS